MKSKPRRILFALSAVFLGIVLVIVLSFVGKSSRGPLRDILDGAANLVSRIENFFIVKNLEEKRVDKLAWFSTDTAFLKNPDRILLGAFDNQTQMSYQSVIALEDSLQITFPLVHIYTAWGSKDQQHFPKLNVKAIHEMGSIPLITWEPWLTAFDEEKHPELRPRDKRDKNGLSDIAAGVYDFYIKEWAVEAAKVQKPIFLRMGHEMNDPYRYPWGPQNNPAIDFIAAWRHVHDVFRQAGAFNVIWVWSPHPAYGYFDAYYPGAQYVDYVGIGTLNYGNVAIWSQWWSFEDIFGKHYPEFAVYNKPIMLTEFGSLATGGDRSSWYRQALMDMPLKYPAVKALVFFHYSDDKTTTQQALNWYIIDDEKTLQVISDELKNWNPEPTQ